jgi:hypothetical protein
VYSHASWCVFARLVVCIRTPRTAYKVWSVVCTHTPRGVYSHALYCLQGVVCGVCGVGQNHACTSMVAHLVLLARWVCVVCRVGHIIHAYIQTYKHTCIWYIYIIYA